MLFKFGNINWRGRLRYKPLLRLKLIKAHCERRDDTINPVYIHVCREICRRERAEKVRAPKA